MHIEMHFLYTKVGKLTLSNALQFLSHADGLQVKLKILMAIFLKSFALVPCTDHQFATMTAKAD